MKKKIELLEQELEYVKTILNFILDDLDKDFSTVIGGVDKKLAINLSKKIKTKNYFNRDEVLILHQVFAYTLGHYFIVKTDKMKQIGLTKSIVNKLFNKVDYIFKNK